MKHACRRMKHFAALPQNMKHRRCGMKQSLFRLHVFLPWIKAKKMAEGIFNATCHSELHFELKNSEFRCEINFWKSLHFGSEKLRIRSQQIKENRRKQQMVLSQSAFNLATPRKYLNLPCKPQKLLYQNYAISHFKYCKGDTPLISLFGDAPYLISSLQILYWRFWAAINSGVSCRPGNGNIPLPF